MKRFKFLILLGLALSASGCGPNQIFTHKPYSLASGRVIEATPDHVITQWPLDHPHWCPADQQCLGDYLSKICPETVPAIGAEFSRVDLYWDKSRRCWKWYGTPLSY